MLPKPLAGDNFQNQLKESLKANGAAVEQPQQTPQEMEPQIQNDELLRNDSTGDYDSEKFDELIKSTADKYNLDTRLLHAVVKAESNYNPNAVSTKGAMGLMQLMPGTAESLDVKNPFNPVENMDAGARFLKSLIEKYNGNLQLALAAYNAGPTAVETYKGIPPYDETKAYVTQVLDMLKQ